MKCLIKQIGAFLLFLPSFALASWQVAKPQAAAPTNPFFQAGAPQQPTFVSSYTARAFPNKYANIGKPANVYAITICGSLKENLERIMDQNHWKLVWQVPYDYNFDGRVVATSFPKALDKLLKPFPLQGIMYLSNRTMVIIPRKV